MLQSSLPLNATKSARVAFDEAVYLLSTLGSTEVQCYQTECDSWRKGFNNIFLWVNYKIPADVTDTSITKNFWLYQNKIKKEPLPKHRPRGFVKD